MEKRYEKIKALANIASLCSAVLAASLFAVPVLHAQEQRNNPKERQMQRSEKRPQQRADQVGNYRQHYESMLED
jgi:hypothetical protein